MYLACTCHLPLVYCGRLQLAVWACCIDGRAWVAPEGSSQVRLKTVLPPGGGRVRAGCGADDIHPLGPQPEPEALGECGSRDAPPIRQCASSRNTRPARPVRGCPWKPTVRTDRPGGPDARPLYVRGHRDTPVYSATR
jgi:hypothetical protein